MNIASIDGGYGGCMVTIVVTPNIDNISIPREDGITYVHCVPLPPSVLPLATNNITAITVPLAFTVTNAAATANFTTANVIATAVATSANVVNVGALTATIATAVGLASAGATNIPLSAIVKNTPTLTAAIATAFDLAYAAATVINNAIALIKAIAFYHCRS